jgi:hypothetical protein
VNTPTLRPLSVGEVLDVGLKIWWRNLWTLFRIVVLIVLPVQVVVALVNISVPASGSGSFAAAVGGRLSAQLLAWVASTLATAACFKAIADAYLGELSSWKTSLMFATRRAPAVLWVTLLSLLGEIGGVLLLVIPGIYLAVAWAVSVPALLLEDVRGRRALGRSRDLVSGRWWPVFGVIVLGTILAGIVSGGLGAVLGAVSLAGSGRNSWSGFLASIVIGTLSKAISTPLTAAFLTVMYVDLRVRKEGFDLQLLAERLGLAPPSTGLRAPSFPPVERGTSFEGEQPPFWPPPPGWRPTGRTPDSP